MTDEDASHRAGDDASGPTVTPESRREPVDDVPTVSCTRCGREWTLEYELGDLQVGNQAISQFALDHKRHTGHFPDGVSTWRAVCRHCPEHVEQLEERPARRWARTHARHTRHAVELRHSSLAEPTLVESETG